MKSDVRRRIINEIDDLIVKLAQLRLGERQLFTSCEITDTLNRLQKLNTALARSKRPKKVRDPATVSRAKSESNHNVPDFAQYGSMAGSYLAFGYYMNLGLRSLSTRLFGRPAS
ncbi:MAG: hypothetical protein ABJA64_00680 [Candidatus Saccharibacteria bacterium]